MPVSCAVPIVPRRTQELNFPKTLLSYPVQKAYIKSGCTKNIPTSASWARWSPLLGIGLLYFLEERFWVCPTDHQIPTNFPWSQQYCYLILPTVHNKFYSDSVSGLSGGWTSCVSFSGLCFHSRTFISKWLSVLRSILRPSRSHFNLLILRYYDTYLLFAATYYHAAVAC